MTLLITALAAAGVAILATVAVERLGGRYGGVLATLPTTILPASWGFAIAAADVPIESLAAVPLGMLVDAGFLWCWRVFPPHLPKWSMALRLSVMIGISLCVWGTIAVGLIGGLSLISFPPLTLAICAMTAHVLLGVAMTWRPIHAPRGTRRVRPTTLLARGTLAGLAIAAAVQIAHSGLPMAAGIFSVFPAIFLTTMVSLWWSQGEAVPLGAVGPIIMGSTAVSAYALLAIFTFPMAGLFFGTILAWVGAVLMCSVPTAAWLNNRAHRTSQP